MRHRFHSLCPYFAMFPEIFVEKHLIYSERGDWVLDPFSGRGTTPLQCLLSGRRALALDISPVAACLSRAKVDAPEWGQLIHRIEELRLRYRTMYGEESNNEFFGLCFYPSTLSQLMYLKSVLEWQTSNVDGFIAAMVLGRLHGESHKSGQFLSNRMPRSIATKPGYSIRWWRKNSYEPPERDVFRVLKREAIYRYESPRPTGQGYALQGDVRCASALYGGYRGKVGLVITSPPYPDTTNFAEDQWLRGWFLGGKPYPDRKRSADDRHYSLTPYWRFLTEAWRGVRDLLSEREVQIVIRIGGSKLEFETARDGLWEGLKAGLAREVSMKDGRVSHIVGGQLISFRPRASGTGREFDFVFSIR